MIYLFSGTPGSGKSLDMARCILNDLRFNRPVICNFPINVPKRLKRKEKLFNYWNNEKLTPSALVRFSELYFKGHPFHEGAICLYIDECQLLFNARTWNIKGRSDWNAFFTNHRHFGYDIILVAQFDRMIDRQIRSLIEEEVIHRKLNNMGLMGLFFRIIFLSPTLFIKISMYYPLHEKLRTSFFRYNSSYAKIYDSYSSVFIQNEYKDELMLDDGADGGAMPCAEVPPPAPATPFKLSMTSVVDKIAVLLIIFLSKIY